MSQREIVERAVDLPAEAISVTSNGAGRLKPLSPTQASRWSKVNSELPEHANINSIQAVSHMLHCGIASAATKIARAACEGREDVMVPIAKVGSQRRFKAKPDWRTSMPLTSPFVFLSHSGADTEAARKLKRRLLDSPNAREAGLKVWFDKDELTPGKDWQSQIEQAIEKDATAFVVYVGSRGVMNWVEAEVRVALSRAITDKSFLFIPVLAAESSGASVLPPSPNSIKAFTTCSAKARNLESCSRRCLRLTGTVP
jgi:hypothetical protein